MIRLFLVLFCFVSANSLYSQIRPKGEPGKCYAKVKLPDEYKLYPVSLAIYEGKDKDVKGIDSIYLSVNREYNIDRLVGYHSEVEAYGDKVLSQYKKLIIVTDTTKVHAFNMQLLEMELKEKEGVLEWGEVICGNEVNSKLIKLMHNVLVKEGFMEEYEISKKISPEFIVAMNNYQKVKELPSGQLNIETINAMKRSVQ